MAPRKRAASVPAQSLRRSKRLSARQGETAAMQTSAPEPPPQPQLSTLDCTGCGESLGMVHFPETPATARCKHPVTTCKACIMYWIAEQLETVSYDKLTCLECYELMQNADVKLHATPEIYERYDGLEKRSIADKTPGWRWCLNPSCKDGQVHQPLLENASTSIEPSTSASSSEKEALLDSICVCNTCGAKACVPCDRPYHEGETCAQYQERHKDEEGASLKTIVEVCKQCPKCKKNIQKVAGCDYVTCAQCWESFCWQCTTPYSVINVSGHGKDCRYAKPGATDPHGMGGPLW